VYFSILMNNKNIADYVGSKIPYSLKGAIERAVKSGSYLNTSDFIRVAIKEKLERDGFWTKAEMAQNQEL
jgi:Arc/MetJ-type ribon-helix-helix transcriptional regulator